MEKENDLFILIDNAIKEDRFFIKTRTPNKVEALFDSKSHIYCFLRKNQECKISKIEKLSGETQVLNLSPEVSDLLFKNLIYPSISKNPVAVAPIDEDINLFSKEISSLIQKPKQEEKEDLSYETSNVKNSLIKNKVCI